MTIVFAIILTVLTGLLTPRGWKVNKIEVTPPLPSPAPETTVVPRTVVPADNGPWGVATKIGEHTYSIKVQNDAVMGTASEILQAINDLRVRNGIQILKTDDRLCKYAQERAEYFKQIKKTDEHKGFIDFLDNQDGFSKLGYGNVGENSSFGYVMSGVHLVEFVYMQSSEHNKNQLDSKWDRGCVGVASPATNIIFATAPL